MSKPIIGISMGDPAGIGPEILVRTVADDAVNRVARCLVYGDARVIEKAVREGQLGLTVRAIGKPDEARFAAGSIEVVDFANADPAAFEPGKVQALCGQAAWATPHRSTRSRFRPPAFPISGIPRCWPP